jgi:hypothetical protein
MAQEHPGSASSHEGYTLDLDALARGAALRTGGWHGSDRLKHCVPRDELTKCGVLFVEEAGITVADEKLGSSAIRAGRTRHGNHAAHVSLGVKLGFDLVTGTTRAWLPASTSLGVWATTLNHKTFDYTVKGSPVIEALLGKFLEILDMTGRDVGPKFEGDIALGGADYC